MGPLTWSGAGDQASTETSDGPRGSRMAGAGGRRWEEADFHNNDRYDDLGLIARGGMGEVRRVFDRHLGRTVAMKLLRDHHRSDTDWGDRFRAEAFLVARLQHPAIVPVLDFGVLRDSRAFFTMPEISGETFARHIMRCHVGLDGKRPPDLSALRRMVGILQVVCEAVAYAHGREVVHRDLKPQNIMVGEFRQVLVLDWGLATFDLLRRQGRDTPQIGADPTAGLLATRVGTVKGTPGFMAPEQARGEWELVGECSDVWSLGAILFQILSGDVPYTAQMTDPLNRARWCDVGSLPHRCALPVPLVATCEHAMERRIGDRLPSVRSLAHALQEWLEGTQNLERSHALVRRADELQNSVDLARSRAQQLRIRSSLLLSEVGNRAPEEQKLPSWEACAAAGEAEAEVGLLEADRDSSLLEALNLAPDMIEARDRLAAIHHRAHQDAETLGDSAGARRHRFLIERYQRGQYRGYLSGKGRLTLLSTEPIRVDLRRFKSERRRLVEGEVVSLGTTPILGLELEIGSYLALLHDGQGRTHRYPFEIGRLGHWGDPSDLASSRPFVVPPPELTPANATYVPAGPTWNGGDPRAFGATLPLRRIQVDGFFIQRHPVTNAEYLLFLDDLVRQDREELALAYVPRERASSVGRDGVMVYGRSSSGGFTLVPDSDGDLWLPDWPVVMIPTLAMLAYAEWWSTRTGLHWRLPWEVEWEKASRGADHRRHVWGGDELDPTWCNMGESRAKHGPSVVDSYDVDSSPYGVRGLAGNVMDTCLDPYTTEGPVVDGAGGWRAPGMLSDRRVVRGGNWAAARGKSRIAFRGSAGDTVRSALVGFRLLHPFEAP